MLNNKIVKEIIKNEMGNVNFEIDMCYFQSSYNFVKASIYSIYENRNRYINFYDDDIFKGLDIEEEFLWFIKRAECGFACYNFEKEVANRVSRALYNYLNFSSVRTEENSGIEIKYDYKKIIFKNGEDYNIDEFLNKNTEWSLDRIEEETTRMFFNDGNSGGTIAIPTGNTIATFRKEINRINWKEIHDCRLKKSFHIKNEVKKIFSDKEISKYFEDKFEEIYKEFK